MLSGQSAIEFLELVGSLVCANSVNSSYVHNQSSPPAPQGHHREIALSISPPASAPGSLPASAVGWNVSFGHGVLVGGGRWVPGSVLNAQVPSARSGGHDRANLHRAICISQTSEGAAFVQVVVS